MATRVLSICLLMTAGCCPDFDSQADIVLDTDADLNAVVGLDDNAIIATADGQLIRASWHDSVVEYSGEVPLNAVEVSGDRIWAVGDEGTFIQKVGDGDWEIVDLGTDARLLDVTVIKPGWLIVVGEGVLRMQSLREFDGGEWFTPPEPAGGWGELRAVFDGPGILAVGAAGVAWSFSGDPTVPWQAEDVGLGNVDLNDGGSESDTLSWIVGDAGSLAYHDGSRWTVVDTGVHADLVEFSSRIALARDGRLFSVFEGGLVRLDKTKGLNRGLFSADGDIVVVGEDGRGRAYQLYECPPW